MEEKVALINEFSPEADFEWEMSDNGVVITRYTGKETDINIPQIIQGKPVIAIGKRGYPIISDDSHLTGVTIPDSILTIESFAFFENQLTSITIPDSVKSIGRRAFSFNQLTSITIPNSVIFIGEHAFEQNKLTRVSLPDSVTFVGGGAFNGNPLANVTGGPQQDGFFLAKSDDGNSMIITYYVGKETDIRIPSEINGIPVTAIGDYAFSKRHLSSIDIPDTVTTIGNGAFRGNKLARVVFPHSVISIGKQAFFGNDLSDLIIPDSVLSIGVQAFADNKLINVSIPNHVTRVEGRAFDSDVNVSGCSEENGFFWTASGDGKTAIITHYAGSEKNVHIPSQIGGLPVTSIGEMAFLKMGLTGVVLPHSVTLIGECAFSENNLTNIVIPDSVTTIEAKAFFRNQLADATFGKSVLSIGHWAFLLNQLKNVSIPFSADIAEDAFNQGVTITRRSI